MIINSGNLLKVIIILKGEISMRDISTPADYYHLNSVNSRSINICCEKFVRSEV